MGCIFSSDGYEPPPVIDFVASRQPQGFGAGRSPARVWLKGLNLEVYSNAFLLAGYDTYEALSRLTETDLRIIERSSHIPIVPAHKMRMLVASSDLRQAASQSRSTEAPILHPPTLQPSPGADAPLPPSAYLTLPAGDPDAHTVATLVAAIEEQHRETASRRQTREQRDSTALGPASPGRPSQSPSRRSPAPSSAGMAYNGQVTWQPQEQWEREQQQQQQQRRRTSRHEGPVERGVPIGVMMPAGQGADPAAVEEKLRRAMAQEAAQVTSPIGTATDRSWHTQDHVQSQAARAAGRTSRSHSSSGRHEPELQRRSVPQYQDEHQAGYSSNSCSAPSSRQHSPSSGGRQQQQQHSRRSSRNEGYESGDSPYSRKQAAAEYAVAGSSAADGSRHSFTDHLRRSFAGRNVSPEPSALDGRAAEQQQQYQYQERQQQQQQQQVTAWPEPGHRQYSLGASSSRQVVLDEYSHSGAASPAAGHGGVETQGTAWGRADQRGGRAPAGACAAYTLRSRRATAEHQLPAAAAEPQAGASVYSPTAAAAGYRPLHRRETGEQHSPAAQVVRQPGAGSRRATADQMVPAPPSPLAAQQPANALAAAICEPVPAMAPAAAQAAAQGQAPAPVPASSRARTSFAGAEPTSAPVLSRTASAEAALLGVTATPLRSPRAHSGAGYLPQEPVAVLTTAQLEAPAPAPAPVPAVAPRVSKEAHASSAHPTAAAAAAAAAAALAGKQLAPATAAGGDAKEAPLGPLQQGLVYSSLAKRPSDQPATPPSATSSAATSAASTASQRAAPAAKPLPRTTSATKAGTSGRGRASRIPAPPTAPGSGTVAKGKELLTSPGSATVAKGKEPPRGRGGGSALSKRIVATNAGA